MTRITPIALAWLLAAPVACAPLATYPPGEQTPARVSVKEPVPTLMSEAIGYAHGRYGYEEQVAINLPAGTPTWVYERIITRLGEGHVMTDPDEPAYHVTEVRARGLTGQVDIFVPNLDGTYRFATLFFRKDNPVTGYELERTRWWDIGSEPPGPNFAGGAPGAEAVLAHD